MKPYFHLIRLIGVMVPRRLRADWRVEWEAELRCREELLADWDRLDRRGKLDLLWRSTSAFWDALLLQPRRLEDEMFQDIRFGVRMLKKQPGFTLIAVLTLALGVGANTAIFSLIYAVLLSPLPYPQAERLVTLRSRSEKDQAERPFTAQEFNDVAKWSQVFDQWSAFETKEFLLNDGKTSERVRGRKITSELLPLLGVRPSVGRAFSAGEFQSGREQVVMISQGMWQFRYGSDPNLIGRTVVIDQKQYTLIGVLPPGFNFFPDNELLLPLVFSAEELISPLIFKFHPFARLKPGMSIDRAQRELNALTPRSNVAVAESLRIYAVRDLMVRDYRRTLFVLWGVVGIVLLIASANFANLLLARSVNRRKEMAIRMAIGARRGRVVRQMLTESVLLAFLGGVGGLFIAYPVGDALAAAGPLNFSNQGLTLGQSLLPQTSAVRINEWVIAFTFGVSLLTGVLFGLAPALRVSRPELNSFLKEGAGGSDAGFRLWGRYRIQSYLIIVEIALAMVLLIGAGLLIKSYRQSKQARLGFQPENLLSIQLQFPWYKYRDQDQTLSFVETAVEELRALPGVQSVSGTSSLPISGKMKAVYVEIIGHETNPAQVNDLPFGEMTPPPPPPRGAKPKPIPWARRVDVGAEYFQTMQIALLKGRVFNRFDVKTSAPVAIISEGMAQRYFPGENPIGRIVHPCDARSLLSAGEASCKGGSSHSVAP